MMIKSIHLSSATLCRFGSKWQQEIPRLHWHQSHLPGHTAEPKTVSSVFLRVFSQRNMPETPFQVASKTDTWATSDLRPLLMWRSSGSSQVTKLPAPSYPTEETHFGRMYLRSCYFGYSLKFMTIGEGGSVQWTDLEIKSFSFRLSFFLTTTVQQLHHCRHCTAPPVWSYPPYVPHLVTRSGDT